LRHYYSTAVDVCITRLGHALDGDVQQLIRDFSGRIVTWSAGTGTPQTIIHGDFRPDNFLIGQNPSAPPMAIVDWQTVGLSLGANDIAYFLGGAFEPAHRREIEQDLLTLYRTELAKYGVNYSEQDCWRDYTWGTLHGVMITVCATMMADQTERGDAMFTLMAQRHARHALDLGVMNLLS
jgi:aminoglycoside phosphotransferase (APT) family kinase protein